MGLSYKDSGVSIETGNSFVKNIGKFVKETFNERVITDIGGFGALYDASFPELKEPVLVSGTDGVGTKLKIAQMMNKHDTIGIDAVAMCVNDILVSGAKPLFFLDYLSCGKLKEDVHVAIVKGIADGCKLAGCSLVGGETAEHPGVMHEDDYDIAGFSVGIVDKSRIINGSRISGNEIIISVESSGVHSNGFSLVRKLFFEKLKFTTDTYIEEFGCTLGEELIKPTNIYCKPVLELLSEGVDIKGMVHITGGGFYENIPRILPEGCGVEIVKSKLKIKSVFEYMQKAGEISEREMFTVFNMGTGLIIIADELQAATIIKKMNSAGFNSAEVGKVVRSDERVRII
ncbi:MAG: phosphoribosylformylglycinamidine cyclo-ligase [Spirochaetes bacterium]|nr:phosphoribosylformylglycinamidine cyclo-ligase [Spirochaetota bacterium]